jgi:predicted RNA-binding Zn-ribbon protein involved in translation (DUF1610 family)
MNTVCPKCAYRRGPDEVVPDYECPQCGVVYEKYRAVMARRDKEAAVAPAESMGTGRDTPAMGVGGDAPSVGKGPGLDLVLSSGTGDRPGFEALKDLPGSASSPDPPIPEAPTPWLRYFGLAAAFLLLVGMVAISAHERRGNAPFASTAGGAAGPSPFAGVYEGSATREIPLSSGRPYEAEYLVRFAVREDGQVSRITWTDGSNLLDQATVSWSPPARIEYTILVREDYTRSFEDPPRGEYNRFTRDGSSFRIEAVHPHGADLRRFAYAGEIPLAVAAKETVTTGLLRASKTEIGASEVVIHSGLPKMGRVEVESGEVTCEFTESAANRALLPYLQGGKPLPDGNPVDIEKPIDGVDIERVMVPRWPGRLWVSFYGVRVRAASRALDAERRQMIERLPQVEVSENSRIVLDFFDPIGWEVRVVFLPDGRAVVRIPARNIEIPVEKVEEVAAVQE